MPALPQPGWSKLPPALRLAISVVIPFHGKVGELEVCLASLATQTNHNFEVVVVADGSPVQEGVLDRLRAQGIPSSLLRLPECQGAFQARLVGANATSGTYLWFLDHDDSVEPHFLERMLARALSTDADVVECPLWVVPPEQTPHRWQRFSGELLKLDDAILESYLVGQSHNNLANKLIRRSLWQAALEQIEAVGLPKDSRLIFCEDMLCTVLLYRNAKIYASTIQTKYHYLQRLNSSTNSTAISMIEDCLKSLEVVLRILQPYLIQHDKAASVAVFRRREVDWNLKDLLRRADHALSAEGWEVVRRIQRFNS
jgi:glycosyltransferase involved in cell wall biosynthesis